MASINDVIRESIRAFEEKIGYEFKNKTYIQTALTHSSLPTSTRNLTTMKDWNFLETQFWAWW